MATPTLLPAPPASSGFHLLQIYGYSLSKSTPTGTSIKSCPFTVGRRRWFLNLFPNGDRPESADFISVFLTLDQEDDEEDQIIPVKLQLEISFIDEVDKHDPAHVGTRPMTSVPYSGSSVGYSEFIEREAFEKSSLLRDDSFTIRCDLVVKDHDSEIHYGAFNGSGAFRYFRYLRCPACNVRNALPMLIPAIHICLCEVCYPLSFISPSLTQCVCAGCHDTLAGTDLAFRPGPVPALLAWVADRV